MLEPPLQKLEPKQKMSRYQRLLLMWIMWELSKPRTIVKRVVQRRSAPSLSLGRHGGSMHEPEVSDHGGMGGLLDDDHTQYFHTDGTDTMTGDLDLGANNLLLDTNVRVVGGGTAAYPELQIKRHSDGLNYATVVSAYLLGITRVTSTELRGYGATAYISTRAANDSDSIVFQSRKTGAFDEVAKIVDGNFELSDGKLTGALDCNSQNLTGAGNITFGATETYNVGASDSRVSTLHVVNVDGQTAGIVFKRPPRPDSDAGRSCATSTRRWSCLYLYPYTDATRGAAGTAGKVIFNDDDKSLNVDDGTNWRDMAGNIT